MHPQLVFLGAPGSGKGTQAKKLASEKACIQVSTGDLLRSEIAKGTALGQKVKSIMDGGSLVDDFTVAELLKANCNTERASYIFDGFPRTVEQARVLDAEILGKAKSIAVYFELDLGVLKNRLVNRRVCTGCGAIFNMKSSPPKDIGVCDSCKSPLEQRKDDNEETVENRLRVFKKTFSPIIDHYKASNRLKVIDASMAQEQVFKALLKAVGF